MDRVINHHRHDQQQMTVLNISQIEAAFSTRPHHRRRRLVRLFRKYSRKNENLLSKIRENGEKSMKMPENQRKLWKINENDEESKKIAKNPR